MNCSTSTVADRARKSGPRFWVAALVGGAVGLGVQLVEGLARSIWRGSEIIGLADGFFRFLDWPAFCVIRRGTQLGMVATHDAIAVLLVFCVYYALLGVVAGVLVAVVLRYFRCRRGAGSRA